MSANEANSAFHPSSNPFIKLVIEANGRWRGERCGVQPTSLSAPSCKAEV